MKMLRLLLFFSALSIGYGKLLRSPSANHHRQDATSYYYSASGPALLGSPNADAAVGNPLKGLLTSPRWTSNPATSIPSSLEFYYIGLDELMFGANQFNWTVLDQALATAASRWKHVIPRIFCHYPGQPLAIPQYLLDAGVPIIGESPQYDDPILLTALDQFIAAFGRRYDGHKSVAFVQLGLLGYWGEWHTYPEQNLLSSATKAKVIAWYKAAFQITPLQLRDPSDGTGIGLHDDSFAYSTLGSTSWFFWPKVQASGQTDFWKSQVMGGETRPELQATIFESGYQPGSTIYQQDFMQCVEVTHATYMLHANAFSNGGYTGSELQKALYAHARMGYNFEVTNVGVASSLLGTVTVDVTLNQTGVAPFYYPLNLTLSCSGTVLTLGGVEILVERGQSQVFSFSNIPASFVCLSQVNLTLVSSHIYSGRPIRFAQGNGIVSLALPTPTLLPPIQTPVIAPVAAPALIPVQVNAPVSRPVVSPVSAPTPTRDTRLTLFDATTDREVGPFLNGTEIDLSRTPSVNLRADPDSTFLTGSVRFDYDGKLFRIDNTAPFAFNGNSGTDYNAWTPGIGRHTVVATPFSGKNGSGTKGVPVLVSFVVFRPPPVSAPVRPPNTAPVATAASPTVSNSPIVSQLLLINADTDKPIQTLVNGTVLTLSALPTRRLNVQAITVPYPTGSVRFAYDTSSNYRMESTIPYALGGDSGGNFNSWTPSTGRHTITAFPYTGKDGSGILGSRISISFTVV